MIDDDEVIRLIREANPSTARRGDPLTERQEALLAQIMAGAFEADTAVADSAKSRRRVPSTAARVYLLAASILAFVLISALVLRPATTPDPAYATPPLLQTSPIDGSAQELLAQTSAAAVQAAPAADLAPVRFQFWALNMTDGVPEPEVIPQLFTLTPLADGGTVLELRELDPPGGTPKHRGADSDHDGLVFHERFGPGEYGYLFPEPPSAAEAWKDYFIRYDNLDPEPTTSSLFNSVRLLLGERVLSPAQNASLLAFLATLPDIDVDGSVIDRLGRPGISYSSGELPESEHRRSLIISSAGEVLAFENIYLGDEIIGLDPPVVIDYTVWL